MRAPSEITIDGKTLAERIELNGKWIRDESDGERLVVPADADLRDVDLRDVDLRRVDLSHADLSHADLRYVDLSGANLRRVDLSHADLSHADLRYVDLSGADLDFACWPLWCGSNHVKVDARIAAQLAAHFCALDCDDPGYQAARVAILAFAKTSHRARNLDIE